MPDALRDKALRLLEDYIDQLPDDAVRGLISGEQALTLLRVDGRLANQRAKGIEETYAFLNGFKSGSDVKALLNSAAPVTTGKAAWIDHTLTTLFGRTYAPPAPAQSARKSTSKSGAKTPKPVWKPEDVAKTLDSMTSVPEGKRYLEQLKPTVLQLKDLARLASVSFPSKITRSDLIDGLLWMTIGSRGAYDRARHG